MLVRLAVVVVDVRGADAVFHDVEGRFHAFADIGVSDIEDEVQIQMRQFQEKHQAFGARKLVGNIFQQDFHAALAREKAELLQRRKGRIHGPLGKFLAGHADVLDQIFERNGLGDFQRALDLIHHFQALAFHRLGDGDDRLRSGAAPEFVVVHGRVEGMQLQVRIAKPVAQFGDLGAIAVVQVLPRAEDLHGRNARVLHLVELRNRQPMIDKQVRGKNVMHA